MDEDILITGPKETRLTRNIKPGTKDSKVVDTLV